MEPEGSLPHLQVPATCPYPEPDQASTCPSITLLEDPLSSNLYLGLPSTVLPSGLLIKILYSPLLSEHSRPQLRFQPDTPQYDSVILHLR
jgi:hypothetical protein